MDLAESARIGGFFALRTTPPAPGTTAHLPLARVYAAGDPDADGAAALRARVDRVTARLGARERRVGASIAQLGLAARLWSTALGPAALYGRFPDLSPATLHWDGALTSPDDLWWAGPGDGAADQENVPDQECVPGQERGTRPATVAELRAAVQEAHLVPLHAAFARSTAISPRLLWGNAGSALAGALRELTRWARAERRPEVAERAAALVQGLFEDPLLARTVRGPALRRTSCCLYYRTPTGGLCGDCVFDHAPGSRLERRPSAP
ncbi:IucA/IucC family C-terminal-domain containing protein [Streptomyces sp. NPDC090025]|uniref:IucA/IucC family C-terminal-domain containing protein n=1 Tax=Streptomyces sp. NPDC090025 TaxID=3365922 RepID=UPI0038353A76